MKEGMCEPQDLTDARHFMSNDCAVLLICFLPAQRLVLGGVLDVVSHALGPTSPVRLTPDIRHGFLVLAVDLCGAVDMEAVRVLCVWVGGGGSG